MHNTPEQERKIRALHMKAIEVLRGNPQNVQEQVLARLVATHFAGFAHRDSNMTQATREGLLAAFTLVVMKMIPAIDEELAVSSKTMKPH